MYNSNCNMCENKSYKDTLLSKIMAINFAINDLTLFLDTHPNNEEALLTHNEYVCQLNELMYEYQENFGPLTINFVDNTWKWDNSPWPWERSF